MLHDVCPIGVESALACTTVNRAKQNRNDVGAARWNRKGHGCFLLGARTVLHFCNKQHIV